MLDQTRAAAGGQTAAAAAGGQTTEIDLVIDKHDREVLRRLAGRVVELAARPVEEEKRERWYRINALEPGPPVIFCDPENGWNEIITADQIECNGTLTRQWEMILRKEIFWGESMGDDRVIEPQFTVSHIVAEETDWGMTATMHKKDELGSYVWDAPLQSYDDLDKLRYPTLKVDQEATDRLVDLAEGVFGDLLSVHLKTSWWWTLGMTWTCITLRGLEQMMIDMCENPDGLKQLMGFLRDGTLSQLDYLQENGLLSLNNDGTYVGSGGFGYTHELPQPDFDGKVRTCDMWGFCESQETVGVSPEHFEEFVFPFQYPILDRFGLNCYGCCEPLHSRWHVVEKFPRLRRISASPWADLELMAEYLQDKYILSIKPSPSPLAMPTLNEDLVRKSLREAFEITRNCRVEAIMKDNHTIGNNPQNVIRWCQIAREEAEAL